MALGYQALIVTGGTGSAFIEELPDDAPLPFTLIEATPLGGSFPTNAVLNYSPAYPEAIKVFDFIGNTLSVPIVSEKARQILLAAGPEHFEFLPVALRDHKGRVASTKHFIVNILDIQDVIDMEQSQYTPSSLDPSDIWSIKRLVLKYDKVEPKAMMFRPKHLMREVFLHPALHEALLSQGVTGLVTRPADGWDGFPI